MALSWAPNISSDGDEEHWISVSDLMAGLMVIFLFVSISYMKDIVIEKERIEKIAVTWSKAQDSLYEDLEKEFHDDLKKWSAILDRDTLAIRFQEPSILFDRGQTTLKKEFQEILDNFFPRYLSVLKKFRNDIEEVRIEGHTSSLWTGANHKTDAYFKNMILSQERTRSVLFYCLSLPQINKDQGWAKKTITANGLSSSKPILKDDGREDPILSRRVEFRVRTNAEKRIIDILKVKSQ